MEKFWAVILIFVIVAAGGLLYVNQVYNPQKETQMAMADTANQTLSAVKLEMGDDTTPAIVDAGDVKAAVRRYCNTEGNDVQITVVIGSNRQTYKNSSDIDKLDEQLKNEARLFMRKPTLEGGVLKSIKFQVIEE